MENNLLNRKESLVLTAIDIIDELGLQGLSIREVAKRQDISNATMFNHFKSKNELIHAVLDHFTQYDAAIVQSIKASGYKSKDAIRHFFEPFATYYENYPAITAILNVYDVLRCEHDFTEKVKNIMFSRGTYLRQMVEEAQELNDIRADIDSECVAEIIQGSFRFICLKWRMDGYSFPLKARILHTLDAILDSFQPKQC